MMATTQTATCKRCGLTDPDVRPRRGYIERDDYVCKVTELLCLYCHEERPTFGEWPRESGGRFKVSRECEVEA